MQRDSDRQMLNLFNELAKRLWESGMQRDMVERWYGPEDNGCCIKVKVHPVQTLVAFAPPYTEIQPVWKHVGTGELFVQATATTTLVSKGKKTKRTGEISGSDLAVTKKQAIAISGADLFAKTYHNPEKLHYTIYKDDHIWAGAFEVAEIWTIEGKCGTTLRAKHLIIDRSCGTEQKPKKSEVLQIRLCSSSGELKKNSSAFYFFLIFFVLLYNKKYIKKCDFNI